MGALVKEEQRGSEGLNQIEWRVVTYDRWELVYEYQFSKNTSQNHDV